jgi:UDP-glucuronate 4-epimerase
MKIFITGSAGFIGFSLAKHLLDKNHTVYGYDGLTNYYDVNLKKNRNKILKKYNKFYFIKGMLENNNLLKKTIFKFKPEIIIHLAAQAGVRYSIKKPRTYLSSNIEGTYNVIELAHKVKVKHLLIASSSSVYGANKTIPYKENDSVKSQLSIYASTKLATESLAHSYSNVWRIPITVMRFFTAYGPWGRPDMALFKFTKLILNKKKIDIYNKGNLYRDFTYIDDIVKGVSLLIKKTPNNKKYSKTNKVDSLSPVAPFRIVNIGNSKKIKLLDFMTLADIKLLKKLTGYTPKINFKQGVKNFINWYLEYYKK